MVVTLDEMTMFVSPVQPENNDGSNEVTDEGITTESNSMHCENAP